LPRRIETDVRSNVRSVGSIDRSSDRSQVIIRLDR